MYCKHCGNQIDDDSKFCSFCQTKQSVQFRPSGEQQFSTAHTPPIATIPPSKKISKYDESYKKETEASIVGVVLLLISFVFALFGQNTIKPTPENKTIISIVLLVFRIIVTSTVVNIAKRQNRDTSGWGVLAFFLPSIALIVIGLQKKLTTKIIIDDSLPADIKINELQAQANRFMSEEKYKDALAAYELIREIDSNYPNIDAAIFDCKERFDLQMRNMSKVKKPLANGGFIEFKIKNGEIYPKNCKVTIDGKVPNDGFYKIKNETTRYEIKTGIVIKIYHTESFKQSDKQVLEIDVPLSAFNNAPKTGYRAWINELPAPDGIYKTGLFSKVSIQDGVIVEKL